ncbi:MAG: hypothetical protein K2Q06_14335 [Parvularculaceae bacterium]|nr:hypothetical protein [Parvularculaceae bacterium]
MTAQVAVILVRRSDDQDAAELGARFRAALPGAMIRVIEPPRRAARRRTRSWRSDAISAALADADAEVIMLADGACDPSAAPEMARLVAEGSFDMATGVRAPATQGARAIRPASRRASRAFARFFRRRFGAPMTDVSSPYRALSRRFVASFAPVARGVEIELELSAHAALLRLPSTELPARYAAREGEAGPFAALAQDWRLRRRMLRLLLAYHPRVVFTAIAMAGGNAALIVSAPMIFEIVRDDAPVRMPTALLATGIVLVSAIVAATGVLLDSHVRLLLEARRLRYLAAPNGRASPDLEAASQASTWNRMFVRRST